MTLPPQQPEIPGGYVLLARQMLESELMNKPPLWRALWVWMLCRATRRPYGKLDVGQFHTSIEEMREALSHRVGWRKVTPSKSEIRKAYEGLTKDTMISTTKCTRGMVVTILNFSKYQNPKNYEGHSEAHNEKLRRAHEGAQDRQEERGTRKNTPPSPHENDPDFERFWSNYPRKVKKSEAVKAWAKLNGNKPELSVMHSALDRQKASPEWNREGGRFIPHPSTWLNDKRWEDENMVDDCRNIPADRKWERPEGWADPAWLLEMAEEKTS